MIHVAFPAKGRLGDYGVHHHFTALPSPQSPQRGKKSKREKTLPGNRMHMAQRRMTSWIQEMERGEEAEIFGSQMRSD